MPTWLHHILLPGIVPLLLLRGVVFRVAGGRKRRAAELRVTLVLKLRARRDTRQKG
jgi:hypothetical protein